MFSFLTQKINYLNVLYYDFIDRQTVNYILLIFFKHSHPSLMLNVHKTQTDLYERFVVVNDILLHLLDVIDSFVECQQLVRDLILL